MFAGCCLPIGQDVIVEKRTELICDYANQEENDPVWVVNDSQNNEYFIYPLDLHPIPSDLQGRGFVSEHHSTTKKVSLRVLGSIQNNQTVVSCWLLHNTLDHPIVSYIINVIGNKVIL